MAEIYRENREECMGDFELMTFVSPRQHGMVIARSLEASIFAWPAHFATSIEALKRNYQPGPASQRFPVEQTIIIFVTSAAQK